MASNDPTDTGGLFIGRRPGTAPIRYPVGAVSDERAGRRLRDRNLAALLLGFETLVCLSVWGPQPLFWLWFGSQVNYWTGSVSYGIVAAFLGMLCTLFLSLALARRIDYAWKLVRRAAGYHQEKGMLERIFVVTALFIGGGFCIWFFVFNGPGSSVFSPQV
ncbi:MAG: hypothetical protein NVSMB25_11130 [Thermoleophilaceae bacterium]